MAFTPRQVLGIVVLVLCLPLTAFAQRELHWEALSADAHLEADGSLRVVETHAMVFSGDWNGGERSFNIRPRQALRFDGISRWNGTAWRAMTEDSDLDSVDDYAFTDRRTLRWRSRLASDASFNHDAIRYQIRYALSGVLLKDGDSYRLDHDFAFPDRAGGIDRFELRLTLDAAWQATTPLQTLYAENGLAPGRSFVLTVPLRYVGTGTPPSLAWARPPAIKLAVLLLLGLTLVSAALFFVQEQAKGRFAPLEVVNVDQAWLRDHILKYPAELVSAAWDDSIGRPEVVALLARLTSERKLSSHMSGSGKQGSMTLHLEGSRAKLQGYERTLVDALFFGGRSTTSPDDVKAHYKAKGFDPVAVIKKDLETSLKATFPFAPSPRAPGIASGAVFLSGLALLVAAWGAGQLSGLTLFLLLVGSVVVAGLASIPGSLFRSRMDWGRPAAGLCLIPALAVAGGTAAFLWFYAGTGALELFDLTIASSVGLALGIALTSINALRSRQRVEGIAFRKTLTAGRRFFIEELRSPRPALLDEWYPWVLAFELDQQMDDWSATSATAAHADTSAAHSSTGSSSTSSASPGTWTGFGGGRSGGAGAGASWAAAAGGFAASVAAPSSSSSGGGSSGGSSSGGSSGGGGGGGW